MRLLLPVVVIAFLCGGCDDDETNITMSMPEMPSDGSPSEPDQGGSLCGETINSMLMRINEARAQARICGKTRLEAVPPMQVESSEQFFEAAPPLTTDSRLVRAAETHSANMANFDFFSHTGLDGSSVGDRVTAEGYDWMVVGENIAAGQQTVQEVVNTWLVSTGHCANIMNPAFTQMGAACVANADSQFGTYWTLVLAAPKQ